MLVDNSDACLGSTVPFATTQDGVAASLSMYLTDYARQRANASFAVSDGASNVLPLTVEYLSDQPRGSDVTAVLTGLRVGPDFRQVTLRVHRTDTTPLQRISVRLTLPAHSFLCAFDGSAAGGGLPFVDVTLEAPPALLPDSAQTTVVVGGAIAGEVTSDLQTVAALGMMGCAPRGDDSGERDNIRSLVPVAFGDTCEGAISGALTAVGGIFVVAGVGTVALRHLRHLPWTQACATLFFPSVVFTVWGTLCRWVLLCAVGGCCRMEFTVPASSGCSWA